MTHSTNTPLLLHDYLAHTEWIKSHFVSWYGQHYKFQAGQQV